MQFARPLVRGTLLRRYKRFLADVKLADGSEATAHCPNPGAMLGVAGPGATVWLEPNDDPRRKLALSWKLTELEGGHLAGIDTSVPNAVAGEALRAGRVPGLEGYDHVRPEVRYGERSRVDFLLEGPGLPPAYVEVKNVHLRRTGDLAEFPDSVTARGARHLAELARMRAAGARAVLLYVIQRTDCARIGFAADLDPAYAAAAEAARAAGVESLALRTYITRSGVEAGPPAPVVFPRDAAPVAPAREMR